MEEILKRAGIEYETQPKLPGRPDFVIKGTKIVVFCDSSFWHGRTKDKFSRNREFWENKLSKNKQRDKRTNRLLRRMGWMVLRFWDDTILKNPSKITSKVAGAISANGVSRPKAIDLFCGAGGLSLGLERAGLDVAVGVEVNPKIARTYAANHPKTKLFVRDVRTVTGKELLEAAGTTEITLLAGCPPCQGFSQLTAKYKREDPRNNLVLEMARLIQETKPKMVMMENVPGLAGRGKPILDEFIRRIEAGGYKVNKAVLQLADYGVPQSRRRFVLLAGRGFEIPIPKPTHSYKGRNGLKPRLTVRDALKNLKRPITLAEAQRKGGPKKFKWHVIRNLSKISLKRLKALKGGANRSSLPKKLRPKCHAERKKGFQNVYGRLAWNQTPPTITSGCTTPCMGRFGHPSKLRTISVREAALIQTFPMNYKFETEFMDVACDLVGNALPPKFAKIVASHALRVFELKGV